MKYRKYQIIQNPSDQHSIKCLKIEDCPRFDGSKIQDDVLTELQFEIVTNPLISSDFYYLQDGTLIYNERVYNSELFKSLESAGQTFQLNVINTENKIYCTNITNCVHILDIKNTVFGTEFDDGEYEILKHIFKPNKVSIIASLFKLPENGSRSIYCLSPSVHHDFYKVYNKEKWNGLQFNELAVFDYNYKDGDWVMEYSKK